MIPRTNRKPNAFKDNISAPVGACPTCERVDAQFELTVDPGELEGASRWPAAGDRSPERANCAYVFAIRIYNLSVNTERMNRSISLAEPSKYSEGSV